MVSVPPIAGRGKARRKLRMAPDRGNEAKIRVRCRWPAGGGAANSPLWEEANRNYGFREEKAHNPAPARPFVVLDLGSGSAE